MRRGAERSDGRSPARGDVRSAGGGGRAGTGAARRGQLLQAGERLPAAGRGICSGPGARQPSHPVRDSSETVWLRGPLRAPLNPSPCRRAWRGRGRSGGGKEESCGSQEDLPPASLRRQAPGCGSGGGGTGQRRVRGARTGEDGGENKGPSAQSAALLPAPRQLPAGAISLHQRCPSCPSWVVSFRQGFCGVSAPQCQGEGHREEGDINWSSLKICRAWDDLDYRRVESRNFPSITT